MSINSISASNAQTQAVAVPFNNQSLITVKVGEIVYTAIKPICENIGLDWKSQYRKLINQKDKFGCGHMTIPTKGGLQEMLCMPIKKLNGWLFSIKYLDKIKRLSSKLCKLILNILRKSIFKFNHKTI